MNYEVEEKRIRFEIWTKQKIFSQTNIRIITSRNETFLKMKKIAF